jgi:hypothetical protein
LPQAHLWTILQSLDYFSFACPARVCSWLAVGVWFENDRVGDAWLAGLQLVLCGDFLQLPPVSSGEPKLFAFESPLWAQTVHHSVELKGPMRQVDETFVRILNEIRWGKVSPGSCDTLAKCALPLKGFTFTKVYTHTDQVDQENLKQLNQLNAPVVTFEAHDTLNSCSTSTNQLEKLVVQKSLLLKIGAQVMCLKNLGSGLVNGALSVVVEFAAETGWPKVQFACGVLKIMTPETWSVLMDNILVAERKQVPLRLAWALSVHKCQGMTLDKVEASLSDSFLTGMVYTALSRVKELSGLRLLSFDAKKVIADPKVVAFYTSLGFVPHMAEGHSEASSIPTGTTSNISDLGSAVLLQAHLLAPSANVRQASDDTQAHNNDRHETAVVTNPKTDQNCVRTLSSPALHDRKPNRTIVDNHHSPSADADICGPEAGGEGMDFHWRCDRTNGTVARSGHAVKI